ncbi:MAG: carboxypeptidase-like regulatory domain-containing protein [Planctomycetota bacterium]
MSFPTAPVLAALSLAGCALLPAQATTPLLRHEVLPTSVAPVPYQDGHWLACRVVDAMTGAPVAGAELFLVGENNTPIGGEFRFLRKVQSDADGFVAMPLDDDRGGLLVLQAEGYGPASCSNGVPGLVWPLARGIDVPVEIRDWLDRPVPGAGVGLCLGCGHTPDVRNATADERGIALLRSIDPYNGIADLYPQHRDLGLDGYCGVDWSPGDPPVVIRASYGAPLRGQVLATDGKPLAGAFVGVKEVHRGPWTRTRADGTFELDGVSENMDLFVVAPDRPDHEFLFEATPPPRVLRLPRPDDRPTQVIESPRPHAESGIVVAHVTDRDGKAIANLELLFVGPHPILDVDGERTDARGEFTTDLPPGDYEVRCDDRRYARSLGKVRITSGERTDLALRVGAPTDGAYPLAERPTVRLDVPRGCEVWLRYSGHAIGVSDLVADGEPVPIPTELTFAFHLSNDHDERTFLFTADVVARQQQPLQLRFLPPVTVRARLRDDAGRPVAGTVALFARAQLLGGDDPIELRTFLGASTQGEVELTGSTTGLHALAVRPERADLRPLLLPIALPHRTEAGATLDLGEIRLRSDPALRVVQADARPHDGRVGFLRLGWHDVRQPPPTFALDSEGGWLGPMPRAGDAVVVPAAEYDLEAQARGDRIPSVVVPFRTVLQGDGPWTVTLPRGELLVEAANDEGEGLDAHVFVADRSVSFTGRVVLRQLPPGELPLVITARGHRSASCLATVPASVRGEVRVVLPAR